MKKSVKEELSELLGWGDNKEQDSAILRLFGRAVEEAWNAGVAAELHCSIEGGYREQKRKDLERIINGPKKGKRK